MEQVNPDDLTFVAAWTVGRLRINVTGNEFVVVKVTTKDLDELTLALLPSDAKQLGEVLTRED